MFIYSRILTKEKKGKVRRAAMLSYSSFGSTFHYTFNLFIQKKKSFLYRTLLAVNVDSPELLAPSTGRENDGEDTK